MKQLSVEEVQSMLPELLRQSSRNESLLIADHSEPIAVLLHLPQRIASWSRPLVVVIDPSSGDVQWPDELGSGQPIFGSCRGMLTIVSEDEEHLQDFQEYME